MKALVFDRKLEFKNDLPEPPRKEGEAKIRVKLAGICNTDLEIIRGYMGFKGILGHEFVGIVVEADKKEIIGKRVVGEINCSCGTCEYCKIGLKKHCPNRSILGIYNRNGVFAEYVTLPETNLHVIPDNVSDEEAVFTEPLAAAFQILEQVHIKPTDKVIVLGDGKLGLLVAQVIQKTGCDIICIGRHQNKLSILQRLGIKTLLEKEIIEEQIADIVIDCTGSPSGYDKALHLLKPWTGKLILKSTYAGVVELNLAPIVINEIAVIGSRCGPFPIALSALAEKKIHVKELISKQYPLEEGVEAFAYAETPSTLKVLLKI